MKGILLALLHGKNAFLDLATGEGKTCVGTLMMAMQWAEGHTVHVATSDFTLAERDHKKAKPFWDYVGAHTGLINGDSTREEHKPSGVYYSTPAGFSLYMQRMALAHTPIGEDNEIIDLILDEADKTILDPNSEYIVAGGDDEYYS